MAKKHKNKKGLGDVETAKDEVPDIVIPEAVAEAIAPTQDPPLPKIALFSLSL